jgi:hypothetical protein
VLSDLLEALRKQLYTPRELGDSFVKGAIQLMRDFAAVLLDAGFYGEPAWLRKISGANDSKKLTPEKRAELREIIAKMEAEGKLKTAWAAGSVLNTVAVDRSPCSTRTHWPSLRSIAGMSSMATVGSLRRWLG